MSLETWLLKHDLDTVLRVHLVHLDDVPWASFQHKLTSLVSRALENAYPCIVSSKRYLSIKNQFLHTPEPCEMKAWNDKPGYGPHVRMRIRRHFEVKYKSDVQQMLASHFSSVAKNRKWYGDDKGQKPLEDKA